MVKERRVTVLRSWPMVIMPEEPWLQKRYYDTSPRQAALSRFLLFVGAEIAEDLVFRTRAKFRFITGIHSQASTNTVFTSVYSVHYPSGFLSFSLSNYLDYRPMFLIYSTLITILYHLYDVIIAKINEKNLI